MATSGIILRLSVLLGLIVIAVNARPGRHFHPCKTLIFVSTSPSLITPHPDFSLRPPSFLFSRRSAVFYITEFRKIDPQRTNFLHYYPTTLDRPSELFPGRYSSSFRDRSEDILGIVGSLLFGVGCGALTVATLYMFWALLAYNRYEYQESDYEFESDDDISPKKMGYVSIPALEAPVTAHAPAKDVA